MNSNKNFYELKKSISKETKIIKEIALLFLDINNRDDEEKKMIFSQINLLKNSLKKENENTSKRLKNIFLPKPLPQVASLIKDSESELKNKKFEKIQEKDVYKIKKKFFKESNKEKPTEKIQEKDVYKIKKKFFKESNKEKPTEKRERKLIGHKRLSNKIFSNLSMYLLKKGRFKKLQTDLVKANMKFLPKIYISIMLFSTFLALVISTFILMFFLFFNLSISFPFVIATNESVLMRFLKFSWVLLVIPIGTFAFMYFYPTLEKGSLAGKINQELPFATINMAAISGSLVDPTKIFSIIILTKEYPAIEKEFIKIINGINIHGYDLITVLRNSAYNSPSKKLADMFNGLATTINSGGDLSKFFEERAKNLLFEYKIDQEKDTRSAETFMDIYISVVIAAPMILMLLMVMIQISGLGISMSIFTLTLIMILGVSLINVVFLTFLHIRQPKD